MDWATVANLIVGVGLPAAEKLITLWSNGAPVTLADFQAIRDQANESAQDRMKAQLAAAGIPLDDPHAVALLALTQGPPNLVVAPPPPPPSASVAAPVPETGGGTASLPQPS